MCGGGEEDDRCEPDRVWHTEITNSDEEDMHDSCSSSCRGSSADEEDDADDDICYDEIINKSGDIAGDITGDIAGDIAEDIDGDDAGDIIEDIVGDIVEDIDDIKNVAMEYSDNEETPLTIAEPVPSVNLEHHDNDVIMNLSQVEQPMDMKPIETTVLEVNDIVYVPKPKTVDRILRSKRNRFKRYN